MLKHAHIDSLSLIIRRLCIPSLYMKFKSMLCCGSEEGVKSLHPALFSHALFISRVVTQWAHSSAHTSPRLSAVIGWLLLLLLLVVEGALHKRCSLSLRSTLLEDRDRGGWCPPLCVYSDKTTPVEALYRPGTRSTLRVFPSSTNKCSA